MKKDYRQNARLVIYGEIFFVILPFAIIFFLSYNEYGVDFLIQSSEWSLAATIVSGQAAVRFTSGLISFPGNVHSQKAGCWSIIIYLLLVLCIIDYACLRLFEEPDQLYFTLQAILFPLSLIVFIVFGGIGQLLIENSNRSLLSKNR